MPSLQEYKQNVAEAFRALRYARTAKQALTAVIGLVLGGVAIIVLVVVVIIIDLFVNTATTISGLSTNQKGNLTNIVNTGNSALNLGAVVPLIIIATVLIGAVLGIFAFRARSGGGM